MLNLDNPCANGFEILNGKLFKKKFCFKPQLIQIRLY